MKKAIAVYLAILSFWTITWWMKSNFFDSALPWFGTDFRPEKMSYCFPSLPPIPTAGSGKPYDIGDGRELLKQVA